MSVDQLRTLGEDAKSPAVKALSSQTLQTRDALKSLTEQHALFYRIPTLNGKNPNCTRVADLLRDSSPAAAAAHPGDAVETDILPEVEENIRVGVEEYE